METLPTSRLYTRDEMFRVLCRAGQFAHVRPSEIGTFLNRCYSGKAGVAGDFAAPPALRMAREQFGLPMVYRSETVLAMEAWSGSLCPLCHWRTFRSPSEILEGIGGQFRDLTETFCPTFVCVPLALYDEDLQTPYTQMHGALCDECDRGLRSYHYRRGVLPDYDTASMALSELVRKPAFTVRVRNNSGRGVRFDPRREAA